MNLLKQLAEPRERFAYIYQFIIKDVTRIQMHSPTKRYTGRSQDGF